MNKAGADREVRPGCLLGMWMQAVGNPVKRFGMSGERKGAVAIPLYSSQIPIRFRHSSGKYFFSRMN